MAQHLSKDVSILRRQSECEWAPDFGGGGGTGHHLTYDCLFPYLCVEIAGIIHNARPPYA
jgi:hypothetical protein